MTLRILVFTLQFPPTVGGVETAAWQLSTNFALAGNQTFVLTTFSDYDRDLEAPMSFQIRRIPLGRANNPLAKLYQKICLLYQFMRTILETKPDKVLCIHWDPCAFIARSALFILPHPPPYYLVTHGMELMQLPRNRFGHWAKRILRSFGLKGASRIFAVSGYTRDVVMSLGIASDRVQVIPNGIAWTGGASVRKSALPAQHTRTLLTVSRLVPRKGHDTVLRALPKIVHQVPDLVYKIAGTGPEGSRLECLVEELGLSKHVRFLGNVSEPNKQQLLMECNVFVMPCRATPTDFEGLGIAFLEAMQYGKPVIAGDSGGVTDIVQNGETGLLVKPDDPEALADAVLFLLRNPSEIERISNNAWFRVRDYFRWDLIAARYLQVLEASV